MENTELFGMVSDVKREVFLQGICPCDLNSSNILQVIYVEDHRKSRSVWNVSRFSEVRLDELLEYSLIIPIINRNQQPHLHSCINGGDHGFDPRKVRFDLPDKVWFGKASIVLHKDNEVAELLNGRELKLMHFIRSYQAPEVFCPCKRRLVNVSSWW